MKRQTRKRECSSYGLSTTKHPLNNSVINSPGRLRRPVPPLARTLLSAYAPEVPRCVRRNTRGRSLRLSQLSSHAISALCLGLYLTLVPSPLLLTFPAFPCQHSPHAYSSLCSTASAIHAAVLSTDPLNSSSPYQPALTNYV